jgi:hypothetical protein
MIGIIWNYRGVAKKGLSTFIKELIWDYKADFAGLQETMKKPILISSLEKLMVIMSSAGSGSF